MENLEEMLKIANNLADKTLELQGIMSVYYDARSSFNHYLEPHSELILKNAISNAFTLGLLNK